MTTLSRILRYENRPPKHSKESRAWMIKLSYEAVLEGYELMSVAGCRVPKSSLILTAENVSPYTVLRFYIALQRRYTPA